MKIIGSSRLTITKDYCHQEVISLFQKFIKEKEFTFFGITSDIDNLGIYVATYGRAKAQNLVDYYTNILIDYLFNHQKIVEENNFVFIPAGEEITILALSKNVNDQSRFIDGLRNFVADKIYNLNVLEKGDTSITFGGKTFPENRFYEAISTFIKNLEDTEYIPTKEYYDLLTRIRAEISICVDKEKFSNFNLTEDSDLIFLRNVIYSQLLNYKTNTQELLNNLIPILSSLQVNSKLKTKYGIDKESQVLLEETIKENIY